MIAGALADLLRLATSRAPFEAPPEAPGAGHGEGGP